MPDGLNDLESAKLISDWGKWIITIEMACIAVVGTIVKERLTIALAKAAATLTVACFLLSIAAAAFLLLSLPEIVQNLQPGVNIWTTKDSIIGRVLGVNTQDLATLESLFFGLGVASFCGLIIIVVWQK